MCIISLKKKEGERERERKRILSKVYLSWTPKRQFSKVHVYPNPDSHLILHGRLDMYSSTPYTISYWLLRDLSPPNDQYKKKPHISYLVRSRTYILHQLWTEHSYGWLSKYQDVNYWARWRWTRRHSIFNQEVPANSPAKVDILHQYIPLKTGFVLHMLAPYSSYSAFVWQACTQNRNVSINNNNLAKPILSIRKGESQMLRFQK